MVVDICDLLIRLLHEYFDFVNLRNWTLLFTFSLFINKLNFLKRNRKFVVSKFDKFSYHWRRYWGHRWLRICCNQTFFCFLGMNILLFLLGYWKIVCESSKNFDRSGLNMPSWKNRKIKIILLSLEQVFVRTIN